MSLISDIVDLLRGNITSPARRLSYGRVPNVAGWTASPQPVQPGTGYLKFFLQEMWLAKDREWLNTYHPMVYSVVSLQLAEQKLELPSALGSFTVGGASVELKTLTNALLLNYPMTPYLPYNGGTVELSAALVGIAEREGLTELITTIGSLGTALAVPQLSTVTAFAAPIASTLNALLGQGKQLFKLGLHQSFTSGGDVPLQAGYFLVCDYDGTINYDELLVKEGRLVLKSNPATPVREFDYMLFRVQITDSRDDLEELKAIYDLVEKAENVASSSLPDATKLLTSAKIAAWQSPDLTRVDRLRVPLAIDQKFADFLRVTGIAGGGAAVVADRPDASLSDRVAAIGTPEVLAMSDAEINETVFGGWD